MFCVDGCLLICQFVLFVATSQLAVDHIVVIHPRHATFFKFVSSVHLWWRLVALGLSYFSTVHRWNLVTPILATFRVFISTSIFGVLREVIMSGEDFFLITLPVENNRERTWQHLLEKTQAAGLSSNFKFEVPDFKVGTLDTLMKESDKLGQNDTYCEMMVRKIANQIASLYNMESKHTAADRIQEALQANGKTMEGYLQSFRWDGAKFNVNTNLTELAKDVVTKVSEIDAEMKKKLTSYNKIKAQFSSIERSAQGNLLTRDLTGIVRPEHIAALDSEFLVTLFITVPKQHFSAWLQSYEKFSEYVAPRSSSLIVEDSEYGLFSATVFRKDAENFKEKCRENRFTVRDFEYDPAAKEQAEKLASDVKAEYNKKHLALIRYLTTMFGEAFIAWIHTKALRLFVESVLRYGLPVNFLAIALVPVPKGSKRLRLALNTAYASLDQAGASLKDGELGATMAGAPREYFPYVSVTVPVAQVTPRR
eukprot:m.430947 g.430947  ORF g.430947 m.430947 type:complete len:480 (-) comp17236_c0_seq1:123-1562(-)